MTDRTDESYSNESEKRIASLYESSKDHKVPPNISQAILSQARKSRTRTHFRARIWLQVFATHLISSKGLAFAAVLTIAISILLQLQFDHPQLMNADYPNDLSPNDIVPSEYVKTELERSDENDMDSISTLSKEHINRLDNKKQASRNLQQQLRHKQEEQRLFTENAARHREQHATQANRLTAKSNIDILASRPAPSSQIKSAISGKTVTIASNKQCDVLTDKLCLQSAICHLEYVDHVKLCRSFGNYCEQNFIQLHKDTEQLCKKKTGCKYTPSMCVCSDDSSCQCEEDKTPSCMPDEKQ